VIETAQNEWLRDGTWRTSPPASWRPSLVFAFGSRARVAEPASLATLRAAFPGVPLVGCSTAGEIRGTSVLDDTLSVTAVRFGHTRVRAIRRSILERSRTREAARELGRELVADDLVSVFVVSDGLRVDGQELVAGLTDVIPPRVVVAGGMAADGADFCDTRVLSEHGAETHAVVAVGFYGRRLQVGHGSATGWDPFGPQRRVTRAEGNLLHELDGQSALAIYKRYLGDHSACLPGAALSFPLSVSRTRQDPAIVRTVIGIDEAAATMILGGEVSEGSYAQLLRANVDRLVDGASHAARAMREGAAARPALALLVSCSGRRVVLRDRVQEEVEAVREIVGAQATLAGFYSYGEIAPPARGAACALHNQTMAMVTFDEE
jgi:hypothetical protein